jgi:hypothetical protein
VISETTFTIRIEQTHECGQLHEYTIHMTKDELFSYTLSSEVPPLFSHSDVNSLPYFSSLDHVMRPIVTLVGHYHKVEMNGMQWKDRQGVTCLRCGKDLLFPG